MYSLCTDACFDDAVFLQTICKQRKHPYCDEFTYCGYAPPSGIEKEWLTASIQCDNQEKLVTVCRYHEGKKLICKDNYLQIIHEDEYKAAVEDYFHKHFPDAELWADVEIY